MSEPTVRPVGWGELAVAASLGALLGAVAKLVLEQSIGAAPAPLGAGFLLLGLAGLVGAMARAAQQRLQVNRERIRPALAVRWLAFARTALVGGAALFAFFGLWTLSSISAWPTPLGRSRLVWSAVATVGALALAVCGRWLENGLKVPPRDDEDDEPR